MKKYCKCNISREKVLQYCKSCNKQYFANTLDVTILIKYIFHSTCVNECYHLMQRLPNISAFLFLYPGLCIAKCEKHESMHTYVFRKDTKSTSMFYNTRVSNFITLYNTLTDQNMYIVGSLRILPLFSIKSTYIHPTYFYVAYSL